MFLVRNTQVLKNDMNETVAMAYGDLEHVHGV